MSENYYKHPESGVIMSAEKWLKTFDYSNGPFTFADKGLIEVIKDENGHWQEDPWDDDFWDD